MLSGGDGHAMQLGASDTTFALKAIVSDPLDI